jgi:hypothetical protein
MLTVSVFKRYILVPVKGVVVVVDVVVETAIQKKKDNCTDIMTCICVTYDKKWKTFAHDCCRNQL